MEVIEKYVRSHEFKDLTAFQISKLIFEQSGFQSNPRAVGLHLAPLVKKKVITRRIRHGIYLYSSDALPKPEPSLTVQTATPVVSNTVQFSVPYATPYAPDEKYREIQAELDATLNLLDSYKSFYRDMLSALRKSYASCDSNIIFLTAIATKLNTAI